ncbi:MAG: hypothetical protein MZU97_19150 [Bacillus subtilis]|nr:hypothetical protein [Bacillus subtilis]
MNRWFRRLLVVALFSLLAGCSAPYQEHNNEFLDPLKYSFDALRYISSPSSDIMTLIADDERDLIIALQVAVDQSMIETLPFGIDATISLLDQMSRVANVSLKTLMSSSSTEFLQVATANQINLSIDDIVGFNDLKKVIETLSGSIGIPKAKLIEHRLGLELTSEEEQGLALLQEYYNSLYKVDREMQLLNGSRESFRLALEELDQPPSASELIAILEAFDLYVTLRDADS